MMNVGNIWIIMWGIVYFISFRVDCFKLLANKGFNIIGNEYYRFFTGLLVHVNLFHLIINAITLYYVIHFLDGEINKIKLLFFSIMASFLANMLFSLLYPDSQSIGGSPVVFSLIALIVVFQIFKGDVSIHNIGGAGQWLIGYAILSNIPIFSNNISTLIIHLLAFLVAFGLGIVAKVLNII